VIQRFEERTGCAVLVNTSFNVRGEPVVCTPYDAYRCFMRTDMDLLVLGNCLLMKAEQPAWPETKGHLEKQEEPRRAHNPGRFARALRRIYTEEFLVAGSSLGDRRLIRILSTDGCGHSTWSDATADQSPKAVFSIPEGIDSANPNAELMARSITDAWSPGPITDALRPVLVSLIKLSQRFPATDSLEEQVPESVYVMF
jgi:carbamoyltransferase